MEKTHGVAQVKGRKYTEANSHHEKRGGVIGLSSRWPLRGTKIFATRRHINY